MGQTRTEKRLERALEALKRISDATVAGVAHNIATDTYTELTEPEVERVETKAWRCKTCWQVFDVDQPTHCETCHGTDLIKLTGHYDHPKQEKKWEGELTSFDANEMVIVLDKLYVNSHTLEGRRVRIELIEEES